jgi:hypothetical protein
VSVTLGKNPIFGGRISRDAPEHFPRGDRDGAGNPGDLGFRGSAGADTARWAEEGRLDWIEKERVQGGGVGLLRYGASPAAEADEVNGGDVKVGERWEMDGGSRGRERRLLYVS